MLACKSTAECVTVSPPVFQLRVRGNQLPIKTQLPNAREWKNEWAEIDMPLARVKDGVILKRGSIV